MTENIDGIIKECLRHLKIPQPHSHKGDNGKLLLIGGSNFFHAASKWSLDVASRFVDMVFYASVKENNDLMKEAKSQFWNGIVIPRNQIESYIDEANCILIGPGMERVEHKAETSALIKPSSEEWEDDTEKIINYLLKSYPNKKWVIDAGALQMVYPQLLTQSCIITPHLGELQRILTKLSSAEEASELVKTLQDYLESENENSITDLFEQHQLMAKLLDTGVTILIKGRIDIICSNQYHPIFIKGGSPGMTKGGSGDVLAGLIGGLYCMNTPQESALLGSYVNKKAGETLHYTVGPFFNSSDLAQEVPKVFWSILSGGY